MTSTASGSSFFFVFFLFRSCNFAIFPMPFDFHISCHVNCSSPDILQILLEHFWFLYFSLYKKILLLLRQLRMMISRGKEKRMLYNSTLISVGNSPFSVGIWTISLRPYQESYRLDSGIFKDSVGFLWSRGLFTAWLAFQMSRSFWINISSTNIQSGQWRPCHFLYKIRGSVADDGAYLHGQGMDGCVVETRSYRSVLLLLDNKLLRRPRSAGRTQELRLRHRQFLIFIGKQLTTVVAAIIRLQSGFILESRLIGLADVCI